MSDQRLQRKRRMLYRQITEIFMICVGVLLAVLGLKGFLLPNGFLDGGVTGISLLVNLQTQWPMGILLVVFNLPFIWMAYKLISLSLAKRSLFGIVALALCIAFIDFPLITSDKLLISLFGGFFLGAGIGFAIRGGSVLDGTEILALFLSRRFGVSVGDVILLFNIILFSISAILENIEIAMYAIITYGAASKTVNFVLHGIEEYVAITIVSPRCELIKKTLIEKLKLGITIYQGKSGYGKRGNSETGIEILYTVVSRLEVSKIKTEIMRIDPDAFMVQNVVDDTEGGIIRRRTRAHPSV